jgi:hypothetical protein
MSGKGRIRAWHLLAAATALVIGAGCGLTGSHDDVSSAPVAVTGSAAPTVEAVPEPEPTTGSPSSKKPARKKTTSEPVAEPTQTPFWGSQLPDCAHRDATKMVAKSKIKAALKSASARIYWRTEAPTLKINYPLIKAVAWQESGWQSNIHNCDGGAGVMQVMPGTLTMMNGRFGLDYDLADYRDNAYAGGNFLAWLTRWAGVNYFAGSQNLSAGQCKSHTSWCLLNVVISGYNAGQGGIEEAAASRTLPNPEYVDSVRSLMTKCRCDQY